MIYASQWKRALFLGPQTKRDMDISIPVPPEEQRPRGLFFSLELRTVHTEASWNALKDALGKKCQVCRQV